MIAGTGLKPNCALVHCGVTLKLCVVRWRTRCESRPHAAHNTARSSRMFLAPYSLGADGRNSGRRPHFRSTRGPLPVVSGLSAPVPEVAVNSGVAVRTRRVGKPRGEVSLLFTLACKTGCTRPPTVPVQWCALPATGWPMQGIASCECVCMH